MSDSPVPVRRPSSDRVLESVADSTRRDALAVLAEVPEPVSVRELATAVAALQTDRPYGDVAHADRKPVAVALVHVHLPKLAETPLLEWAPGEAIVPTVDRAAPEDGALRALLSVDADDWDAVLRALADRRRRLALAVLEAADGPLDRDTLARRVAARELDVGPSAAPDERARAARTELRHTHLPALRDAGLVADDGESVAYVGHPEVPAAWLTAEPLLEGGRVVPTGDADTPPTPSDGAPVAAEPPGRSVDGADD